jgi:hypothetical protein
MRLTARLSGWGRREANCSERLSADTFVNWLRMTRCSVGFERYRMAIPRRL